MLDSKNLEEAERLYKKKVLGVKGLYLAGTACCAFGVFWMWAEQSAYIIVLVWLLYTMDYKDSLHACKTEFIESVLLHYKTRIEWTQDAIVVIISQLQDMQKLQNLRAEVQQEKCRGYHEM